MKNETCTILVSSVDQSIWAIATFHRTRRVHAFAFVVTTAVVFRALVHVWSKAHSLVCACKQKTKISRQIAL